MVKIKDRKKEKEHSKEQGKEFKKARRKSKELSRQLEEKWIGSRSEVFTRIIAKETEIRTKTAEERRKAERLIEDAKGEAATIRREATMEEIGRDYYEREMEKARQEAEEFRKQAELEAMKLKEESAVKIDEAVEFVVKCICPVKIDSE